MNAIKNYLIKRKRQKNDSIHSCRSIPSLTKEAMSYYPDIAYTKDGTKAHKMDMYCPRIQGPLPVIINVHGDRVSGGKEYNRHFCMNLCKQGYVVFSVNYRLGPEASLTEQIQDLADAAAHIHKRSIDLKLQAENIFLVGDRAGAMLIYYLLAVQNDPELAQLLEIQPAPISFAAAALISGPIFQKNYRQRSLRLRWNGKEKFRGYQFLKTDHPILVEQQPPTLFFTSSHDDGYRELMKLIGIYEEKERIHQVIQFGKDPDYYTGFSVMDPELPESLQVMQEISDFFQTWRSTIV